MGLLRDLLSLRQQVKDLRDEGRGVSTPGGLRQTWSTEEATPQGQGGLASQGEDERLLGNGVETTAQIAAFRDTGMTVSENPVVEFDLDVASGGSTTRVSRRQVISRLSAGKLAVGNTVHVRTDAVDRTKLVITSLDP